MKIIQCAEKCIYQQDGYCGLEEISTVNSVRGDCPHCIPVSAEAKEIYNESADIGDSLSEGANPD